MNETLKNIAERYSCRDFADTPLTAEQEKALVDAALAAPSAMNRQPWHIIVIKDKALIDEMDASGMAMLAAAEDKTGYDRMMARGGKLLYNAPFLINIVSDGSNYGTLDSGIQCQNIVLAAQSLGLGTCIVGMAGLPLTGPKGEDFKKAMKFPEGGKFEIGILVGSINSGKEPHELDYSKVTYVG